VTFEMTRKRSLAVLATILLALGIFALGFVSCLHLKQSAYSENRERQLLPAGDATPEARAGVLASLRAFQAGYVKRNPADIDSFMKELFPKDGHILILGTEGGSGEWVRGYPAATDFIRTDWQEWGDVRLNVDNPLIWSSGDVAWLATVGAVRSDGGGRPLRLTAVLMRDGDTWRFRQLHFQWDDSDPSAEDILRPKTYLRLFRAAIRRLAHTAG